MKPEKRKIHPGLGLTRNGVVRLILLPCLLAIAVFWQRSEPVQGQAHPSLRIRSESFSDGAAIPRRYTCDGANISPQLAWQAAPAGTKSFAMVMNDPDAPVDFTHWLVWNIAPAIHGLAESASPPGAMPQGAIEGKNSFGRMGYGGPCPPPGKPHHYVFRIYALDVRLDLPAGATRNQVEAAMSGHIVAQGQVIGTYQRTNP